MRRCLLLIAVAAGAVAGTVVLRLDGPWRVTAFAAGSIRGRVDISAVAVDAGPRPGVAELGTDPIFRARERRDAVVYIDSAPQAAFEGGGGAHVTMSQTNESFVPHVLAIRVGTVVDFPNNDVVFHNVFSLSKAKRFDLGRYAKGRSKSVRFDDPGIVRVFCDIHTHMNAFILVFAHRYFSVTDDQGRYHIDQVPPGTYSLVAWYEGTVRQTRSLSVPEDGRTVEADFTVR